MVIDFNNMKQITIQRLNNGEGEVNAKMFMDDKGKVMISKLPSGSSIGLHTHKTSSEINYVMSGTGKAICDNEEEILKQGTCQYCKKGSSHSIENTGADELVLFTVVCEQ